MKELLEEILTVLKREARNYEIAYDNTGEFYFEWKEIEELTKKVEDLIK